MTVEATRQKKPHAIYRLANGNRVPGVTTILGVLDKPALVHWAWSLGLQQINYREYKDALADVGTITHLLVECDLRGVEPELDDYTPADVALARNAFSSWENWKRGRTIEPILLEEPLVSEKHRFGGTIDIYAHVDGVPTLLDIKTSKAIYSEHLAQVVAYEEVLEEHGHPVDDRRILRIGRTEDESFEERAISERAADLLWEMFLRCRDIYELQKLIKAA